MSEEAAFLAALKANPADDTTRLVYADWLDEHGAPAKAEYLRRVVYVARTLSMGAADSTAIEHAATFASALPREWRLEAACRFGVEFEGFDSGYKLESIKFVREVTGLGLGESKRLVESAPVALPLLTTIEGAAGMKAAQLGSQLKMLPNIPLRVLGRTVGVFTVFVRISYHTHSPLEAAEAAFRNFLIAALGVSADQAVELRQAPQDVELASGLEYPELESRLRYWRSLLPPDDPMRHWGIDLQTLCSVVTPSSDS
jgi:uncharacterized protein (TIGR02996 family)